MDKNACALQNNSMQRVDNKIKGVAMLTVMTALAKVIGALYKIPLVGVLGAEGMGYYQAVFPLYAIVLTVVSSGVTTATARLTAMCVQEGCGEERVVFKSAIALTALAGLASSALLGALALPVARIQGDVELANGYRAILPAVAPASLVAVVRGYFQGKGNLSPSAVSHLVEQGSKLALGLALSVAFSSRGKLSPAVGALTAVALSELLALLFLVLVKRQEKTEEVSRSVELEPRTFAHSFFRVMRLATPLLLMGVVAPLSHFVDSVMVLNLLSPTLGTEGATASYGLYSGAVCSLMSLPSVLTVALTASVIPTLASCKTGEYADKLNFSLRLALTVGALFAVTYASVPRQIVGLLYPSLSTSSLEQTASLTAISALSVIFTSAGQIFSAFLSGVGAGGRAVRNAFVGLLVKIALAFFAIPRLNIEGCALSAVVGHVISCACNAWSWQKYAKSGKILKNVSGIGVSSVIIFCTGKLISLHASAWALPVGLLLCALYVVLVLRTGTFSDAECKKLPLSGAWLALKGKRRVDNEDNRSGAG